MAARRHTAPGVLNLARARRQGGLMPTELKSVVARNSLADRANSNSCWDPDEVWNTAVHLAVLDGLPPARPFQGCRAGSVWLEDLSTIAEVSNEETSDVSKRCQGDDVSTIKTESTKYACSDVSDGSKSLSTCSSMPELVKREDDSSDEEDEESWYDWQGNRVVDRTAFYAQFSDDESSVRREMENDAGREEDIFAPVPSGRVDETLLAQMDCLNRILAEEGFVSEPADVRMYFLRNVMEEPALEQDNLSLNTAELFGSESSDDDATFAVWVVPEDESPVKVSDDVMSAMTDENVEERLRGPNERHLKRKFSRFLEQLSDKAVHELVTHDLFDNVTANYLRNRERNDSDSDSGSAL